MPVTKPILLIDGDQFLYRACAACETEIRWDLENHVLTSNAKQAYELALGGIQKAIDRFQPASVRVAYTKTDSFRRDFYGDYKGNRLGVRKPMCYVEVREELEAVLPSKDIDGLEADDVMGIWATKGLTDASKDANNYIIVSDDKDLKTIPCQLYRMGVLETITPEMADWHWMYQTLVGDTADNFPGCPGTGKVGAEKLLTGLTTIDEMWPAVVGQFQKAGLTIEDALTQARLARILRATDWDATKKEVILWTP